MGGGQSRGAEGESVTGTEPEYETSEVLQEANQTAQASVSSPAVDNDVPKSTITYHPCDVKEAIQGESATFTCTAEASEENVKYSWEWNPRLEDKESTIASPKQLRGEAASEALRHHFHPLIQDISHPQLQGIASALFTKDIISKQSLQDAENQVISVQGRTQSLLLGLMTYVKRRPAQFDTICSIFEELKVGMVDDLQAEFERNLGEKVKAAKGWKALSTDDSHFQGADSATLTILRVHKSCEGRYRCIIQCNNSEVVSQPATHTVVEPPRIVAHPQSIEGAIADSTVSFNVEARGSDPLSFSWQKGDGKAEEEEWLTLTQHDLFHGVDTPTLTIQNVIQTDKGSYRCVVSNRAGTKVSTPAALTLANPPRITTQPQNVMDANPGKTVTFRIEVTGTPPFKFSWQRKEREDWQPLSSGDNFQGMDTPVLTILNVEKSNEGSYQCVIKNGAGIAVSQPVTLSVGDPPEVTIQPQDVGDAIPRKAAAFTVEATGSLEFKWERSAQGSEIWEVLSPTDRIQGTNTSTLTILSVVRSDEGRYRCTISNKSGSVMTEAVSLTLVDAGSVTAELLNECMGKSPSEVEGSVERFVQKYGNRSEFARKGLMAVVKMDHEQLDTLKAFLKAFVPAEFEEDGWTPLQLACIKGHSKIVWELLENGGRKRVKTKDGRSLLHLAVENGSSFVVGVLIFNQADLNTQDKRGRTPLHIACAALKEFPDMRRPMLEIIENLLNARARVDMQDEDCYTPLHIVCANGDREVFQMILEYDELRSSLNARNKDGNTPLHLASYNGFKELVQKLKRKGATIVVQNEKQQTPLHLATAQGHLHVVNKLLKYDRQGRSVNTPQWDGNTALHLACREGYYEIAEALLQNKAEPNILNNARKTPAWLAQANGHQRLLTLKGLSRNISKASAFRRSLNFGHGDVCNGSQDPTASLPKTFPRDTPHRSLRQSISSPKDQSPKASYSPDDTRDPRMSLGLQKKEKAQAQAVERAFTKCFDDITQDMEPPTVAASLFAKGVIDRDTLNIAKSSQDRLTRSQELVLELIKIMRERPNQFTTVCGVFESKSVSGVQNLKAEYHKQLRTLEMEDACTEGDCDTVRATITQCGVDSEIAQRAMMLVAGMENQDISERVLETLLQCGVSPEVTDTCDGWRPIQEACTKGNFKIVRAFSRAGVDRAIQTTDGRSLLHLAAECVQSNIVTELLGEEANVHALDQCRRTPLHCACETAASIISAPEKSPSRRKQLPHQRQRDILIILENLLRKGAKTDAQDEAGNTPLHVACSSGNKEVVDVLLRHDKECKALSLRNNHRKIPLDIATQHHFEDIVKTLLAHSNADTAMQQQTSRSGSIVGHVKRVFQ